MTDICEHCKQKIPTEPDVELIKRTNRRRMAWSALISNIIIIILAVFYISPEKLVSFGFILEMFFIVNSGIVATYMGSSAWITRR